MMEFYRGDVFYVMKGGKTFGSEQQSGRPAVIVSNDMNNKFSETLEVVYLTTQEKKDLPTHCEVMGKLPSTAICEQIFTVSKERVSDFIRTCTDAEMDAIDRCISESLGLVQKPEPQVSEPYYPMEDPERVKLETERDLYKQLYEQMMERMMK